ncbi:MAG: hypothetical protein Q9201_002575 [Fulgogasparrea decipioides]
MSPEARLTLLSALVMWSLGSSEAIQAILKERYKQQRHDDDKNQPLSVQPWGRDGDKRRYWLIEGLDDTPFRLYRESNPALKHSTWRSVAGSIEDLKQVATRLGEDGSQAARKLCDGIQAAIPRFEAGEDKRRRREYRLARKAQFTRPELGFSLYEGRTRGKKMKYTFSEEEDGGSDAPSARRSNRQSGLSTPAEPACPTVTASGRQVKSRYGGMYGETVPSGRHHRAREVSVGGRGGAEDDEERHTSTLRSGRDRGRPNRPRAQGHSSSESMGDESDVTSSGQEWNDGDDDEAEDLADGTEDEEMNDDISEEDELAIKEDRFQSRSLVVSLRYTKPLPFPQGPKETSNIPDSDALSNQAPPPEANPFAVTMDTRIAAPDLSNGHTPSNYDASIHARPNEMSSHDYDKAHSMV